ncbi:hypothetical protein Tco_1216194, partial [Tanacetum coccineum]
QGRKGNSYSIMDADRGDEAYITLSDVSRKKLTAAEIDIENLEEATRLSIATARSLEDLEAQHNVEEVQDHLVEEEIEQIMERNDNIDEDDFVDTILNTQEDPVTRMEPESHKEKPKVEKSVDVLIINDDEEE